FPEDIEKTGKLSKKRRPMTYENNMNLMNNVSELMSKSLNMNDLLKGLLDAILKLLKRIDRGLIILVDPGTKNILDAVTSFENCFEDTIFLYSKSAFDRVIKTRKAVMILDAKKEISKFSESMKLMKIKSLMCVPLISRSKIMGVIYVDSVSKPYGFRRDDLNLLCALSGPAALAIELYSKEKEVME
ncbi:MAG: GAF domain-containing protein, partial [Pseudomonadota bacterium]